jgi:hypothetical protein
MFAHPPFVETLRRLVAAGALALVVLLNALAVSPEAHAWIHAHEHAHDVQHPHTHTCADAPPPIDDEAHVCAITLFAQGVTLALAAPIVAAPPASWIEFCPPPPPAPFLTTPRYLRQPERGPRVS